jgi:hypothetical protein
MPDSFSDQMNARLRELRGTTIDRERPEGGIGEEIADALRNPPRGSSPKAKARTAEPVGPEPTIEPDVGLGTAMGQYRRWVYQHRELLDSASRLPGERGYDPSSVGQGDTFELVTRRVGEWRDRRRRRRRSGGSSS